MLKSQAGFKPPSADDTSYEADAYNDKNTSFAAKLGENDCANRSCS